MAAYILITRVKREFEYTLDSGTFGNKHGVWSNLKVKLSATLDAFSFGHCDSLLQLDCLAESCSCVLTFSPQCASALRMTPPLTGIPKPLCQWCLSSFLLRGRIVKHRLAACVGSAVVPTAFVSELIVQRCLCGAEVVRTERTSLPAVGHCASQ